MAVSLMKNNLLHLKHYIFDFDGTLVTSQLAWSKIKGKLIELGKTQNLHLKNVTISEMLYALDCVKLKKIALSQLRDFELSNIDKFILPESSITFLEQLHNEKYEIAIYSNNFNETIQRVLRKNQLIEQIDIIIGRDNVEMYKPMPEGILKILNHWKCEAKDVLFIGNKSSDQTAAEIMDIQYVSIEDFESLFI